MLAGGTESEAAKIASHALEQILSPVALSPASMAMGDNARIIAISLLRQKAISVTGFDGLRITLKPTVESRLSTAVEGTDCIGDCCTEIAEALEEARLVVADSFNGLISERGEADWKALLLAAQKKLDGLVAAKRARRKSVGLKVDEPPPEFICPVTQVPGCDEGPGGGVGRALLRV